jgi:hypothetical protein
LPLPRTDRAAQRADYLVDVTGTHCYEQRTHMYSSGESSDAGRPPAQALSGARAYAVEHVDYFLEAAPRFFVAETEPHAPDAAVRMTRIEIADVACGRGRRGR